MYHHTLDPFPKPRDKAPLYVNEPWLIDRSAIARIHRQKYPDRLELYKGNLILVGINYDRTVSNDSVEFKHHSRDGIKML